MARARPTLCVCVCDTCNRTAFLGSVFEFRRTVIVTMPPQESAMECFLPAIKCMMSLSHTEHSGSNKTSNLFRCAATPCDPRSPPSPIVPSLRWELRNRRAPTRKHDRRRKDQRLDLSHESADEGISVGIRGAGLIPMTARVVSVKSRWNAPRARATRRRARGHKSEH